jgi:hypothetical protein
VAALPTGDLLTPGFGWQPVFQRGRLIPVTAFGHVVEAGSNFRQQRLISAYPHGRVYWHLDERPLRADNEINPDVLGCIFEKYINQKQMGAYFTKEDITGYIARNTLVPYLFNAAEKKCAIAFKPDSALWRPLRDDPDRYAGVFYRRGLIEQWGRGTQKIVDWCVAAGQPEPDFEQQAGDVVVRFRPSGYHPPLTVKHDLTERQREILLILSDRRKSKVHDILAQLENPPSLRSLQLDLRMLRDLRLVQTSGRGGNARWWIAPIEE